MRGRRPGRDGNAALPVGWAEGLSGARWIFEVEDEVDDEVEVEVEVEVDDEVEDEVEVDDEVDSGGWRECSGGVSGGERAAGVRRSGHDPAAAGG